MKRIFVVGAPRSGTTLLQAMISQRFKCFSMRETHFFKRIVYQRYSWVADYYISRSKFFSALETLFRENELSLEPRDFLKFYHNKKSVGKVLSSVMDSLAFAASFDAWVEKSPEHVFWVKDIEASIPDAQFLHTVRPVEDIVASIVDAGRKYGGVWARCSGIDEAIAEAGKYILASLACSTKNHHFVPYETLADRPKSILPALSSFLELEIIVDNEVDSSSSVFVRENEPWKKERATEGSGAAGRKFDRIFSEEERSYITESVSELNKDLMAVLNSQEKK